MHCTIGATEGRRHKMQTEMIDAITDYWNHRIHDLEMTDHPVGTQGVFR